MQVPFLLYLAFEVFLSMTPIETTKLSIGSKTSTSIRRFKRNSNVSDTTCRGSETPCAFPFSYVGVQYNECSAVGIQYSGFRLWCATKPGPFSTHRQWVLCNCSDGYPVLDTTEELYDGGETCRPYRENIIVFVDRRYNQTALTRILIELQEKVLFLMKKRYGDFCYDELMRYLCFTAFPHAFRLEPNGTIFPRPLCRDSCIHFSRGDCSEAFAYIRQPIQSYFAEHKLNPIQVYLDIPQCNNFPPNLSLYCETIIITGTPSPSSDKSSLTIVAIVLGLIGLLGIVIISIFCSWRYRKIKVEVNVTLQRLNSKFSLDTNASIIDGDLSLKDMLEQLKSNLQLKSETDVPNFSLENIAYVRTLGEGTFGQVFLGVLPGWNRETIAAIKVLKAHFNDQARKDFETELHIMTLLNHPNIVTLLAKSESETEMGLIFEYMCHGDLNHFLRSSDCGEMTIISENIEEIKHVLTPDNLSYMIMQICCALSYLAESRFVHRDIATRNCLVGKGLTTKLADFGLSKEINSDYYRVSGGKALLPVRWLAPESLLYGKSSLKSDIWAFGVLIWEALTFGRQPYYGMSNAEVIEFVTKGGRLEYPKEDSPALVDITKSCWHYDSAKRPTAAELLTRF